MTCFVHRLVLGVVLLSETLLAQDQALKPDLQSVAGRGLHEVWGEQTNGLRPVLSLSRAATNWYVVICFRAETNFARNAWLRPTNRVCSVVELWLTNGQRLVAHAADVLDAARLPKETTVPNIMRGVERHRRGLQWMRTDLRGSKAGEDFAATSFGLRPYFDLPLTNDLVCQIAPLLYRVDADETRARLVTFPSIRIKLLPDGGVQKVGNEQ